VRLHLHLDRLHLRVRQIALQLRHPHRLVAQAALVVECGRDGHYCRIGHQSDE
jgi:hypothetical protein